MFTLTNMTTSDKMLTEANQFININSPIATSLVLYVCTVMHNVHKTLAICSKQIAFKLTTFDLITYITLWENDININVYRHQHLYTCIVNCYQKIMVKIIKIEVLFEFPTITWFHWGQLNTSI